MNSNFPPKLKWLFLKCYQSDHDPTNSNSFQRCASPNLHDLHCSNKNSSRQDLYSMTLANTQSKPHLEIQIINCKKKKKKSKQNHWIHTLVILTTILSGAETFSLKSLCSLQNKFQISFWHYSASKIIIDFSSYSIVRNKRRPYGY